VVTYAAGIAVLSGAGLVAVPIYARVLQPTAFGVVETLSALLQLAVGVLILGFDSALAIRLHGGGHDRSTIVTTALALPLGAALIVSAAAVAAAGGLTNALFGTEAHTVAVVVTSVAVAPAVLHALSVTALRHLMQPTIYLWATVAYAVGMLGIGVPAVLTGAGTAGPVIGLAAGSAMAAAVAVIGIRAYIAPDRIASDAARSLLRIGIPLIPAAVLAWTLAASGRLWVLAFSGPADVGLYSAASKLALLGAFLVSAVMLAWNPYALAMQHRPDARERYAEALVVFVAGSGAVLVLATPWSEVAISLLAGDAFVEGASTVWMLLASAFVYGAYAMVAVGAQVAERTALISLTTAFAVGVNVVASIALVPALGFVGAAIATLLGYIASAVALFVVAQRVYPVPYPRARLLLLTVVALSASGLLAWRAEADVAAGAASAAVAAVLCWTALPALRRLRRSFAHAG
jgi:O-antigen/teichoic acid export membrane protein